MILLVSCFGLLPPATLVRRSRLAASTRGVPEAQGDQARRAVLEGARALGAVLLSVAGASRAVRAEEVGAASPPAAPVAVADAAVDMGAFKLPYFRENVEFRPFLGQKATIVFNMKIDDPQTVLQFPDLAEIYRKYKDQGLNVHAFPTEQGWFEPDDDETCRAKAKEYYSFGGEYPKSVVFDKIDILGPSAHPLYRALTKILPTPNGYGRITLNYEKFLLDANGNPLRRYPRKYSAYDMEEDLKAVLEGKVLPEESPAFQKAWREAKREVEKSEYAFRFNYNYYDSPDSMYKYDEKKDKI